jgi:O-ureido-D-serine cyclo-ligase
MSRIALGTAVAARPLDDDLAPLSVALKVAGAEPVIACWDDPSVSWGGFDMIVLRSTWDYPQRIAQFLAWVDLTRGVTRVMNPLATIRWNADKHYLADLTAAGVSAVATGFVAPGSAIAWPDSPEFVVKPTISAGSRDTARFARADTTHATALVEQIWASGRTAMVQPYLDGVDHAGEHALVYFDGVFSHAFRKGPLLVRGTSPTEHLFAAEQIDPATPTPVQIEVADAAIAVAASHTGELPLYGRVDLVPGPDGTPVVLELELIEPSVYLHTTPGSADRFAAAILERIGR